MEAMKAVPSATDPSKSQYQSLEAWLANDDKTKNTTVEELIIPPISASDHDIFAFFAGVPAIFFMFGTDFKKHKYPQQKQYPTYHTSFDTFYLVDKFLDPGFSIHKSCSQLGMHMMLQMAESALLPLATRHFVAEVKKGIKDFEKKGNAKKLRDAGLDEPYKTLNASINEFAAASHMWTMRKNAMQRWSMLADDPMKARMLNDQIMKFERLWIMPKGLPGRENIRHAIFSPPQHGGPQFLPGISDLLHELHEAGTKDTKEYAEKLLELRKHLSDLMIMFRQAASWLQPFDQL